MQSEWKVVIGERAIAIISGRLSKSLSGKLPTTSLLTSLQPSPNQYRCDPVFCHAPHLTGREELSSSVTLPAKHKMMCLTILGCVSESEVDIIVLGEHNLFYVSSEGNIQSQLSFHGLSCFLYPVRDFSSTTGHENLLVGTSTSAVLVYEDQELVWAAKASSAPVALSVGDFGDIFGLIIILDDKGQLSANYLGTDPLSNAVGAFEVSSRQSKPSYKSL